MHQEVASAYHLLPWVSGSGVQGVVLCPALRLGRCGVKGRPSTAH